MFVFTMTYLKSVHTVMLQPIASTINTLPGTLYEAFSVSLHLMKQGKKCKKRALSMYT
ncbi:hypothetical protein Hanom_Chr12g01093851 [Helianthus anomalus]